MQHDHVLKKLNLGILTPSPGSVGGGGGDVGVSRQNFCDHDTAFLILFNLTRNMTMF